jgi:type VI secretion system protein ImpE
MTNELTALSEHSLDEHMGGIERQIRARPQDAGLRLAFCHFLAVRGQWARAQDQLNAAVRLDPLFASAASTCAMALKGEQQRQAFWAGGDQPAVLGDAVPWVDHLLSVAALPAGQATAAAALRELARDQAPALSGRIVSAAAAGAKADDTLDGEPVRLDEFAWLCDGDVRLGPVFEAFVPAGYGWLPMPSVGRIKLRRPQHLVDLLWAPATVELVDGRGVAVLLPVRYPADLAAQDDALALARRTDWLPLPGEEQFCGAGQRVLTSDAGDHPLLEIRTIEFTGAEPA